MYNGLVDFLKFSSLDSNRRTNRKMWSFNPQNELELIHFLAWSMIIMAIIVAMVLIFTKNRAWYGRYGSDVTSRFLVPARVAWFMQESPALVIPLVYVCWDCRLWSHWENRVVMMLYFVHYIQRTLIYPLLIRGGKESTISIVLMAASFCALNGYMQGRYHCSFASYGKGYATSPVPIFGVVLFFTGFIINVHSDHILRSLRKPGETGYKIPQGGLFNYISGANFFGEIIEWAGYALYAQSLPAFAFALFAAANIGPRAIHHHNYYKQKFEDYPKNRKALIPFVL